jgi:hypothetical protein
MEKSIHVLHSAFLGSMFYSEIEAQFHIGLLESKMRFLTC